MAPGDQFGGAVASQVGWGARRRRRRVDRQVEAVTETEDDQSATYISKDWPAANVPVRSFSVTWSSRWPRRSIR
ncbi:hypothetical protein [Streptomyces sp. NPDC002156]